MDGWLGFLFFVINKGLGKVESIRGLFGEKVEGMGGCGGSF